MVWSSLVSAAEALDTGRWEIVQRYEKNLWRLRKRTCFGGEGRGGNGFGGEPLGWWNAL